MKKIIIVLCIALSVSTLTGCVSSTGQRKDASSINRIAIASFSVSDWGGSVKAGSIGTTSVAKLIGDAATQMLQDTEEMFAKKWSVAKVSSFVKSSAYRNLRSPRTLSVVVPEVNGQEMVVFTDVSSEIKSGQIDPKTAMDLCQALDVDGVALIFSEWTAQTGGIVPLTKAVTKNVFTIWDRNGQLVIKKRVDMMGRKPLGFSGFKAMNENTITEWQDSFSRAMDRILQSI